MVLYQQSIKQLESQEKQLQPLIIFSPTISLTVFKTVIFKSDISDHFPICFLSQNSLPKQNNKENMFIYKRTYNTESIELFKQKLHKTKWDEIMSFQNADDAYKAFLNRFSTLYDTYLPEKKIKLKNKDLQSP